MNWQRFAVMNIAAVVVLTLLGIGGYLTEAFTSAGKYGVACSSVLTILALSLMAAGQWGRARLIRDNVTVFGLVGTVFGVIEAFANAKYGVEVQQALESVGNGVGLALFSTASGLLGYLWLTLVIWECDAKAPIASWDEEDAPGEAWDYE